MIRTILIDDEPAALRVLELLLLESPAHDISIIGSYTNPHEGKEMILQHQPDLVFIDVEMPSLTGIDLLKSIPHPPFRAVFVTAYDAYALEAFRLSALDYLLKPVDRHSVEQALQKIRSELHLQENQLSERLHILEQQMAHQAPENLKIALGSSDEIIFLPIADILFCEARGAYTDLYLLDGNQYLSSKSLGIFENHLEKHGFFRIHHRYLINLSRIKSVHRGDGGYVVMENDHQLEVAARRYRDFLQVIRDQMI